MPMTGEFKIHVPDERLGWIASRVRAFPWDAFKDAGGWPAGMPLAFVRDLADYWLNGFDWRAQEANLNARPQFMADIDDQRLHFQHIRSSSRDARPLLLLHGWPGSFAEFDAVVDALARPQGNGDSPAFDIVIPSLPGYGFSNPLARPVGPRVVAGMMAKLMRALGYDNYVAQGGDWGAIIATSLAIDDADHCRGLHINMMVPSATAVPDTDEERAWKEQFMRAQGAEGGYSHLQMTRPQSLAFAMADSPVGVAAWMVEKFAAWADLPKLQDGTPDVLARFTRDQLLTNIMLYLAEDTFGTSTWLYYAMKQNPLERPFTDGQRCLTPTGVAAFPDPVFKPMPRTLAERSYNIVHWTDMPRGGHFAAMEAPDLFVADVRSFVRGLGVI